MNQNYGKLFVLVLLIIPKKDRQLHNIASCINKIREFRNRIYHYEPVLWSFYKVEENYKNIIQLLPGSMPIYLYG